MPSPAAPQGMLALLPLATLGWLGMVLRRSAWDVSPVRKALRKRRSILLEFAFDPNYAGPLLQLAERMTRDGYDVIAVCDQSSLLLEPWWGGSAEMEVLRLGDPGELNPSVGDHLRLAEDLNRRGGSLLIYDSVTALVGMVGHKEAYLALRSLLETLKERNRVVLVVFPWAHEHWEVARFRALVPDVFVAVAGRIMRIGE